MEKDYKTRNEIINKKELIDVLDNNKEMANLINTYLTPKKRIKENSLQKVHVEYINKRYTNDKIDLIYKWKKEEVIFLIKYQFDLDDNLPLKILSYCIDIMREGIQNSKQKNIIYPIVVPIVVYVNNKKCKVTNNFKYIQIEDSMYRKYKIDMKYNLIDINRLSTSFLLNNRSIFGYIMLLLKSEDKDKFEKNLNIILKIEKKNKELYEKIIKIFNLDSEVQRSKINTLRKLKYLLENKDL